MGLLSESEDIPPDELTVDDFDEFSTACFLGKTKERLYQAELALHINQQRFATEDYRSESPIVKEHVLRYLSVPDKPVTYKFEI